MAGAVDTTYTFTATDVITSTKMNNIIDETVMTTDAIIGSTLAVSTGKLRVNTSGITANELATGSVTTTAILDANVTPAKLANSDFGDFTVSSGVATIDNNAIVTSKIADSNVTLAKLSLPSGFPIQIAQAVKTDVQTITSTTTSWSDITGLSVTLTRAIASASGKVRIQGNVSTSSNDSTYGVAIRLVRDGLTIDDATGDADGLRLRSTSLGGFNGGQGIVNVPFDFIDDSPGSNATVTYKVQAKVYSIRTGYINRSNSDANVGDYSFRTISSITLTELAP
jgi:hypothetical protein